MSATPSAPPKAESLSLSEMLRIMDVATEMRSRRETVEKEFAIDETKRLLREKLLQTTAITGERVTEAEVDAAIESYFRTLYTFHEPDGTWAVVLARFYVRRGHLLIVTILAATLLMTGWWVMRIASTRYSPVARLSRQIGRLETTFHSNLARAQALAREPSVKDELNQLKQEAGVAREQLDQETLTRVNRELTDLINQLNETYEVRILADPHDKTGFDRGMKDGDQWRPAYYLIVYTRDEQGQSVPRKIENAETHQFAIVDRWAEQVPQPVYDRIKEDKKADGVLSETLFSIKERGYRNEEIRLKGTDGKPIERGAQLTDW